MSDSPPLDPKEALVHIRTLAPIGQDSPDEATAQKHFEMIVALVDKALARGRK